MDKKGKPVMVTTKHRGVFFGYVNGESAGDTVTLHRSRMCVYWSADVRGVLGLASGGPTSGCRITHAVAQPVTLRDVTMVAECSPEAAAAWERAPWS